MLDADQNSSDDGDEAHEAVTQRLHFGNPSMFDIGGLAHHNYSRFPVTGLPSREP
jgi:hypothetical protein